MGTEIMSWDEDLAREAKEIAAQERPSISQISLRAGVMQYRGVAIPGNKLKCIIVASAVERRYDTKPFDPSNITPPDCFALSITGQDMVPDPNSSAPQAANCAACPHNAWQPNPKRPGTNHKPCKERRRIVLVPADSVDSGTVRGVEMAMLAIPVTSVKHWATYVNRIASEFSRPPWGMITEISVTPNPKTQFEVKFEPLDVIPSDHLPHVHARIEGAKGAALVPYDATGYMVPEDAPERKDKKPAKY